MFRLSGVVAVVVLLLAMIAMPVVSTQAQEEMAMIRVVHASPDAPAVDVYLNGEVVDALTDVPFFTASDFLEVPAGEYQVQVAPAGTSAEEAVIDAMVTVNAGSAYTIAAVGLLDDIQASVFEDDLSSTPAGEARVSVFHLSPDAPAVAVKLTDGTVLADGLGFTDSGTISVPAGTYDIIVTPSGADDVVIDLSGTTVEEGVLYSVFATNTLENITPQLATTQVGTQAPAPTEAPAATEEAAPAPTAAPTHDQPATLPETSEGNTVPVSSLALVALALIGSGALVLALRRFATR
jgi:hypothetical protein